MSSSFDIADSTDWLNTPLKLFAPLENALHCQVCKEFLDTPMITSCSHTFCSKCIRTSLSADGKCPACRAPDQASKLRNNWTLQEIVTMFLEARPAALQVATTKQEVCSPGTKQSGKRKRAKFDSDDRASADGDGRTTRSKARKIAASQESIIEVDDSDGDADFEPEHQIEDGKVECPLGCGKRMKLELVEPHLDRCEDERKQASKTKSNPPMNGGLGPRLPTPGRQEQISQLNYSLVKETALRKKMDELGIPSWGAKALMERRHKEWVNIWNANCDSSQPRPKRELLADLKAWERTQGGNAPQVTNHLMKKEFDAAGWASKHNDEFSRLIADARRPKSTRNTESAPDEDDKKVAEGSVGTAGEIVAPNAADSEANHSSEQASRLRPYENNDEAIASIRQKVADANSSPPLYSQHFRKSHDGRASQQDSAERNATGEDSQKNGASNRLRRASTQDEHAINEHTGTACELPSHLAFDGSSKRLSMFDVPSQSFTDMEGV
nr:postreplication repair e3 ubiquitin-protein ligase rad18 [Quercus suber]